jgi:hypothetical protein
MNQNKRSSEKEEMSMAKGRTAKSKQAQEAREIIDLPESDDVIYVEGLEEEEQHLELLNAKVWAQTIRDRPKEPMLIENILPAKSGEYIIEAGGTGRGKTNLIINSALCLATGTLFLGTFKCEKCKVGLIFLEGDDANLTDRYLKASEYYPDTEDNLLVNMFYPEEPKILLKKISKAIEGCRVVLLDGARYLVPGDYIKPRDCRNFTTELRNILKQNGSSGILTFQVTKAYARGLVTIPDVYAVKGGTDLVDDATTVILIEKTPNKRNADLLTVYFGKHRASVIELEGLDLIFDRDTCGFALLQDLATLEDQEKRARENTVRLRY